MNSARVRLRIAAKTREQLDKAGLPNLAALRCREFARFGERQGWPGVTRPRAVQILNLLYEQGPKTAREIAAAIGVRVKTSKYHPHGIALTSNDKGGTYTAELLRLGLIVRLGRKARYGNGRGQAFQVYAIAPGVVRGPVQSARSEAS